jgi:hypothetical protein
MTAKPDLTRVWAAGAPPANIEDPDVTSSGKFNSGWVAEVPPFENFNFLQKLFTQGLAHANEYGIMQWDSTTSYPEGAWARSTVDDEVYVSLTDGNQNNEPSASSSEWNLLSSSYSQGIEVGIIVDWPLSTPPANYLALALAPTDISRTTYSELFAVIGTTWGAGDGSTTFGMPYVPADRTTVMANGNIGTTTVGQNLSHRHSYATLADGTFGNVPTLGGQGNTVTKYTDYEGGSANLPAGSRMLKCIKYRN